MSNPIRVLHVLASLDRGGAEAMIMSLYRYIDKSKIQFDFVVNESSREYAHEEEIKTLGGRIFHVPRYTIFNYVKYKKVWNDLVKKHPEWKIIHGHHTSPAQIYLKVAKKNNLVSIAHSHTADSDKTIKSQIKYLMRYPLRYIADYLFACSIDASEWMFGRNNLDVHIIKNAIDSKAFNYNEVLRAQKRSELGLSDKFIIGHIGNFSKAKNYPWILEVYKSIRNKKNNVVLVLVGMKENNPKIEAEIKQMGLEKEVILTGTRSDIPRLLQAIDVLLMPSLYEGLPVTLLEAQASGLKCVISDSITQEVKITDYIEFVSLNKSADYWAEQVIKYSNGYERRNTFKEIFDAGYDVNKNAKWLENFYITLESNSNM